MHRYLLLFLISPFVCIADNLNNSNQLFNLAEHQYTQYFQPAGSETFEYDAYLVRYYAQSGNYIGTKDNKVYVFGSIFNGLQEIGLISDYIQLDTVQDDFIAELFSQQLSNEQVQGQGIVIAILADDLVGSRHQRFIIELQSGQTLLIAHNIDLAPKIENLSENDLVEFYGEYEWNDQGGVIHWTHYDPAGKHIDGWLKHHNILYQSL